MTVDGIDIAVMPLAAPPRIVTTDDALGARRHRADWSTVESIASTIVGELLITRAMDGDGPICATRGKACQSASEGLQISPPPREAGHQRRGVPYRSYRDPLPQ